MHIIYAFLYTLANVKLQAAYIKTIYDDDPSKQNSFEMCNTFRHFKHRMKENHFL